MRLCKRADRIAHRDCVRRRHIVTGGGDGCINIWALNAAGGLSQRTRSVPLVLPEQAGTVEAPMLRSVCVDARTGAIAAGTAACDIWAVPAPEEAGGGGGGAPEMVHFGHQGELHGVATNPRREFSHVFATVSDACRVAVWSALSRQVCALHFVFALGGSLARAAQRPSP